MSTASNGGRARKETRVLGTPMVDASFTESDKREQVRAWWQTMGRLALMSLSVAALTGCGGGSAEARCRTTGAWLAQNEGGPVIVIARACKPGGDE